MHYKQMPEYKALPKSERDALDAFLGAGPFSVDDATMERIMFGRYDDDEPDWRALAQELATALKAHLDGDGGACDGCDGISDTSECDIAPCRLSVPALAKARKAGLEV